MLIVFRYITGADHAVALFRFREYLKGQEGISQQALAACLKEEGYTLSPCDEFAEISRPDDGAIDKDVLGDFWKRFQGQAVMLYGPRDQQLKHAVLVCSGGIVFDPGHDDSLEDGEFIVDHFDRLAWTSDISIRVLRVWSPIRES